MFLDQQSIKRIAASIKREERTPRNKPVGRRRHVTPQRPGSASQIFIAYGATGTEVLDASGVGSSSANPFIMPFDSEAQGPVPTFAALEGDYVVIKQAGFYYAELWGQARWITGTGDAQHVTFSTYKRAGLGGSDAFAFPGCSTALGRSGTTTSCGVMIPSLPTVVELDVDDHLRTAAYNSTVTGTKEAILIGYQVLTLTPYNRSVSAAAE